jgi:hypothetical protein
VTDLPEPWLDKRQLAAHLACSVRSVETAMAAGMPNATIFGRAKFRASEAEAWLEAHGYLVRNGAPDGTIGNNNEWAGGAENAPAPDTRR